jgi:hypothetical protein
MSCRANFVGISRILMYTTFVLSISNTFSQTTGTTGSSSQAGWLISGNVIGPNDLQNDMASVLHKMGDRMTSANNVQLVLAGTTTDVNGSRPAQITIQAPGYLSYREGSTRAITFNGSNFQGKNGQLSNGDQQIAESFLAHFPDTVLLQECTGGSLRRIPGHFRTDSSRTVNYMGSYWRVFEFAPSTRPGLAHGQPLQQELFVAVDESSWLISEIRLVTKSSSNTVTVTQTQFTNWFQQNGQWYPGNIVRLENGAQVLNFKTSQGAVGGASPITAFVP